MALVDTNVSNGTCYYSAGNEAPARFIPCGNAATDPKPCCESLDMCLSSNACYNGQFGVTYLAGCTDPDFLDISCPNKGDYSDQIWVGLVYCNGTSNEWVACEERNDLVTKPEPCWCPSGSRTVAFRDASRLDDIMALPASKGESVTWQGGHGPFAAPTARTTHESSNIGSASASQSVTVLGGSTSTTSMSTITGSLNTTTSQQRSSSITQGINPAISPASTTSNREPSLSTGAKIGVGIGAGLGAIVLFAIVGTIYGRWRRMIAQRSQAGQANNDIDSDKRTSDQHEDLDLRSPAWSGHKSELPNNESFISPASVHDKSSGYYSETACEIDGTPTSPLSKSGFPRQESLFPPRTVAHELPA